LSATHEERADLFASSPPSIVDDHDDDGRNRYFAVLHCYLTPNYVIEICPVSHEIIGAVATFVATVYIIQLHTSTSMADQQQMKRSGSAVAVAVAVVGLISLLLLLSSRDDHGYSQIHNNSNGRRQQKQHRRGSTSTAPDSEEMTMELLVRQHRREIEELQARWEDRFRELEGRVERLTKEEDFSSAETMTASKRRLGKRADKNINSNNNNEYVEEGNAKPPSNQKLNKRLEKVESLAEALACVNTELSTKSLLLLDGCNLQIVNGRGSTDLVNGRGNVLIGYNEAGAECNIGKNCFRQGSHNLIVGSRHEYKSTSGIVAGTYRNILILSSRNNPRRVSG